MKVKEIIENRPAKITKVRQGVEAEIDNGDGTKTVVDLKKNPAALSKDDTGKIKLNKTVKPGTQNKKPMIKPGDVVDTDENK